jgi:hypothetical protein
MGITSMPPPVARPMPTDPEERKALELALASRPVVYQQRAKQSSSPSFGGFFLGWLLGSLDN